MNNQLQITWAQPCEENTPISKPWSVVALRNNIQNISCRIKKFDNFANSLSSAFASNESAAQKVISRNILR